MLKHDTKHTSVTDHDRTAQGRSICLIWDAESVPLWHPGGELCLKLVHTVQHCYTYDILLESSMKKDSLVSLLLLLPESKSLSRANNRSESRPQNPSEDRNAAVAGAWAAVDGVNQEIYRAWRPHLQTTTYRIWNDHLLPVRVCDSLRGLGVYHKL